MVMVTEILLDPLTAIFQRNDNLKNKHSNSLNIVVNKWCRTTSITTPMNMSI